MKNILESDNKNDTGEDNVKHPHVHTKINLNYLKKILLWCKDLFVCIVSESCSFNQESNVLLCSCIINFMFLLFTIRWIILLDRSLVL